MAVTPETIKQLREMTSCGVMECKKALEESGGDFNKAKEVLRLRGLEIAAKKSSRQAKEGRLDVYVHPGNKLAVLVEVNCETDFVAKNDDFVKFTKDVAMHIAASDPKYVGREEVPADELAGQADPEEFFKQVCLLDQPFVRDPGQTIKEMMTTLIAKTGENIGIRRFARYRVG